MAKNEPSDLSRFEMPSNFIEQVYELSGGADKYKGMILAYVSEDGVPVIYSKFESQIVEFGLRKAVEKYLRNVEEMESALDLMGDDDLGSEEED